MLQVSNITRDDVTTVGITQGVAMEMIANGTAPHTVTSWEVASHEMTSQLMVMT